MDLFESGTESDELITRARVQFPVDSERVIGLAPLDIEEASVLLSDQIFNVTSKLRDSPVTAGFLNMRNHIAAMRSEAVVEAFCNLDYVFADGVGLQIVRGLLKLPPFRRVSGTDTVPAVLRKLAAINGRVFLLGGTPRVSARSASNFATLFPGLKVVGHHHGFLESISIDRIVAQINASGCDLLLIGMGTPCQELWLQRYKQEINAKLAVCVGGLFSYWSGDLVRAPEIFRTCGMEWLWILVQQPAKWRIYTLDAFDFLRRVIRITRGLRPR